jgi:hypothetical protein
MTDEDRFNRAAGASTEQHVTGHDETGDFITDKEPAGDTPAHGSGNEGVNVTHANRVDEDPGAHEDVTG